MSKPNSTPYNLIKENKNHEHLRSQTIPCSNWSGQTGNTPGDAHVTAPNSGKVRQVGLVDDTLLQLVLPDNILL